MPNPTFRFSNLKAVRFSF